ncbi:helix-turn-helix domain-containing protein [Methylobacterium sp. GC_Met_2]|uniref:helix-turn-helix domain-containing protein n=1 Tax=Methylobacterium sp. GC_Met_2 TaxID=2937376 RepID=UPI00226B4110|nr:helix-turn-helix domain-containing protein [Methylobacterium sp. GC_Met_2]
MKATPAPLLNTLDDTRARLGLGKTKVRELVNAGDLEAVKVGSRTLVTEASIARLVGRLPRIR